MKPHGTYARYHHGKCRCRPCTEANTDYLRNLRVGDFYASHATRDEVKQWARGLGLPVNGSLQGRNASALIARYNAEHPDRPYQSRSRAS
jgi:hypothetical protein